MSGAFYPLDLLLHGEIILELLQHRLDVLEASLMHYKEALPDMCHLAMTSPSAMDYSTCMLHRQCALTNSTSSGSSGAKNVHPGCVGKPLPAHGDTPLGDNKTTRECGSCECKDSSEVLFRYDNSKLKEYLCDLDQCKLCTKVYQRIGKHDSVGIY